MLGFARLSKYRRRDRTIQGQNSVFEGPATSLELRYTSKPVSGWGGMLAVMRYFERRAVRQLLQSALPNGRTSPNQIPVVDLGSSDNSRDGSNCLSCRLTSK